MVTINFCSRVHAPLKACCGIQSEVYLKAFVLWEKKRPSENLSDLIHYGYMVPPFESPLKKQKVTPKLNGVQPVRASQVASENLQSALQQPWAMEPWAQRVDPAATCDYWFRSSFKTPGPVNCSLWFKQFKHFFCPWGCMSKQRSNSVC